VKKTAAEILTLLNNVFKSDIIVELSSRLGLLIALMLIAWLVSFSRIGFSSFLIVFPAMVYNFGTMLLLCTNDYRYFHFNCILAYPCILMLLSVPRKRKAEKTAIEEK
ncbi:MAG: hypothetical protein PHY64_13295, partial [Eubacteriales bacterium]|nr:hypothetical protein [Eubacteriales bacterium]